jgi:hypothetical protein
MSAELQRVENEIANISADVRALTNAQTEMMISLKEFFTRQEISLQAQEKTQQHVERLDNRVVALEIEDGKASTERDLGKYIIGTVFVALVGIWLVNKPGNDDQREILQIMKSNYGAVSESHNSKQVTESE